MVAKESQPQTITIDRKVTLASIWTMLGSLVGLVVYLNNMNNNVVAGVDALRELKVAVNQNTAQIVKSDRSVAVLENMAMSMERRIAELEKATKR
jgi:hypothetical protein